MLSSSLYSQNNTKHLDTSAHNTVLSANKLLHRNDLIYSVIKAYIIGLSCGVALFVANFLTVVLFSTFDRGIIIGLISGAIGGLLIGQIAYRDSIKAITWDRLKRVKAAQSEEPSYTEVWVGAGQTGVAP